jgi:hypothetical protein
VRAVRREAVGANTKTTAQAKDVLLVLPAIIVDPTGAKECLSHQPFQPCRLHVHVHVVVRRHFFHTWSPWLSPHLSSFLQQLIPIECVKKEKSLNTAGLSYIFMSMSFSYNYKSPFLLLPPLFIAEELPDSCRFQAQKESVYFLLCRFFSSLLDKNELMTQREREREREKQFSFYFLFWFYGYFVFKLFVNFLFLKKRKQKTKYKNFNKGSQSLSKF